MYFLASSKKFWSITSCTLAWTCFVRFQTGFVFVVNYFTWVDNLDVLKPLSREEKFGGIPLYCKSLQLTHLWYLTRVKTRSCIAALRIDVSPPHKQADRTQSLITVISKSAGALLLFRSIPWNAIQFNFLWLDLLKFKEIMSATASSLCLTYW